ncbi:hypothetical protein [Tissierella creatinophila]|uniref:Uncharacterized protein n=1 Tax=Tissierella creatinophila DSM 6911 TaxID=1123403 RepID=A0A1U7M4H6_TISCR|nr:hypothetical protein [Tissierella creatinophila]OLS02185.1 hypothetical protein TICRE_18430 [Tissierella creatinophila DSM 6911]
MMFAQVLNGKAHYIFKSVDVPNLPPDSEGNPLVFVDITYKPNVQEGWEYNEKTNEFTEPIYVEPEENTEQLTIHEEILFETKYQTLLLEIGGM